MGGKSGGGITGYKYYIGMHLALCHGPIDELQMITVGEREAWSGNSSGGQISIDAPELFGGDDREGGVSGEVDVLMGNPSQAKNDYLQAQYGSTVPAYRGIVSLILRQCYIGNNPYLKNWAFRLKRTDTLTTGTAQWYPSRANINDGDLNPAHIVRECLTNSSWGVGYPASQIDDAAFQSAADALYTEAFGLSLMWSKQEPLDTFIQRIMDHIDGRLYVDPATGLFTLTLIRDDYDPAALDLFDESNTLTLDSFERRGWGETVNEISVVYRDRDDNTDKTITVHDIGNIQIQGGVVTQTVQYPGISNADLAARVALRDLRAAASPLSRLRITVNRAGWDLGRGDPFKFSWAKLGINTAVYRVINIDTGELTDGRIAIDAIEDVFALPDTSYVAPQPSGWVSPNNPPAAAPYQQLMEAGYWDVQMNVSPADIAQMSPEFGFVISQAVRPSEDTFSYQIQSLISGSEYIYVSQGFCCPTAELDEHLVIDALVDRVVSIKNGIDLDQIGIDSFAYIGAECVAIRGVNIAAGTITIDRGILDTVPVEHADSSRIWFADGWQGLDRTERVDAEFASLKLLPTTTLGTLDIGSATALYLTLDNRYQRPYPPGNIKLNATRYPVSTTGDIAVTWSHRDRILQTAYLVNQTEVDIGPEPGTTYTVRIYDTTGPTLMHTENGMTGTSWTYTEVARQADFGGVGPHDLRIEIESVRDELTSRQMQAWECTAMDN